MMLLTQLTRPSTVSMVAAAAAAASKRSVASTVVRSFANEEPKFQFEKAHNQVAPLTDPTLYAPQGNYENPTASAFNASSSAQSTTASSTASPAAAAPSDTLFHHDTNSVFTPSVNAVFDD